MKTRRILTVLLLSLCLLTGCGVELTSHIELNSGFEGTRTMSCTFSSGDLTKAFKGEIKDLDQVIKDSCPKQLTYKKATEGKDVTYTFSLEFSSLSDYKEKTESILSFAPEITYEFGDSPFVSGLRYKENFSSTDLMSWLYTALYEKEYISSDSPKELMDLKETTIDFQGKTYTTKDQVSIDEMNYIPISSIEFHTSKKDLTFYRTINFYISKDVFDKHKTAMDQYFSDSNISYSNWSDGKIMSIKLTGNSFHDISIKTAAVLNADGFSSSVDTTPEKNDPFTFTSNYKETIDLTNYVNKEQVVPVTYFVNEKRVLDESIKKKTVNFTDSDIQKIDSYEITTLWKDAHNIRRQISFSFDNTLSKTQLTKLKNKFGGNTFTSSSITKKKKQVLSIVQEGSVDTCNKDLQTAFPSSSMKATSGSSFFKGKTESYTENISMNLHNKNAVGTYTFATISNKSNIKIACDSENKYREIANQKTANRQVANLINGGESISRLVQYEITGSEFSISYSGNTAASHWINGLKVFIPLLFFVVIAVILFWKQEIVLAYCNQAKDWIEKTIDRFNKK